MSVLETSSDRSATSNTQTGPDQRLVTDVVEGGDPAQNSSRAVLLIERPDGNLVVTRSVRSSIVAIQHD